MSDSNPGTLGRPLSGWRLRLYTIIFEADTRAGRLFDQWLIVAIVLSVLVVLADSVHDLNAHYDREFQVLEWGFTALFTVEYVARLACVRHPWRYATSFFGIVDLLSVLPTYVALLLPGAQVLIDVRILRLLRIFRILKLTAYVWEYQAMGQALVASRRKILVFLSAVLMIVVIMGTLMYVIEGPRNGFTSIPTSVYWAITTMTTVGFGDITPKTDLGRLLSSVMMLVGWGTLAVPTGIVTSEMTARRMAGTPTTRTCHECLTEGHLPEARHCMHCGARLTEHSTDGSARPAGAGGVRSRENSP
jgi:voltage-gated potassium channel